MRSKQKISFYKTDHHSYFFSGPLKVMSSADRASNDQPASGEPCRNNDSETKSDDSAATVCLISCGCTMNFEVTDYCEDHSDVVCLSCKTLKHGKCKTIPISQKCDSYPASTAKLNDIIHKANALKDETDQFLNERNLDLQKLASVKYKCEHEIKIFRKEVVAFIDQLEKDILKKLDMLESKIRQDIEKYLSTFSATKQTLEADEKLLCDAQKSLKKTDMFVADVKVSTRLNDYERLLKDIRNEIKPPNITFERNKALAEMRERVFELGTLTDSIAKIVVPKERLFTDIKVVVSSQINVTLPEDDSTLHISGCAFLPDGQVVLCDHTNKKVKLFSSSFKIYDTLDLPTAPWDISVIEISKAIITLPDKNRLQYVHFVPALEPGRVIQLDTQCSGVEVHDQEMYMMLGSKNGETEVRVLALDGTFKRKIGTTQNGSSMFKSSSHLAVSVVSGKVYVSERATSTVICLMPDDSVVYKYCDRSLTKPRGICVDSADNLIVCGNSSNNVHIVTADGLKNKVLLTSRDGIKSPHCVAYRHSDNTLIVGCYNKNMLYAYKLA